MIAVDNREATSDLAQLLVSRMESGDVDDEEDDGGGHDDDDDNDDDDDDDSDEKRERFLTRYICY